jgi:hypothetical protein
MVNVKELVDSSTSMHLHGASEKVPEILIMALSRSVSTTLGDSYTSFLSSAASLSLMSIV